MLRTLAARLIDRAADHIHHADLHDAAHGLTVTRLSGGGRIVHDPRLAVYAERRRERVLREGLDPLDRALIDEGTRAALAATAARLTAEQNTRRAAAARRALDRAA